MIYHVLKDGTVVPDVQGHMIKAEDFPALYETINRIQQKEGVEKNAAVRTPEARS